MMMAWKQLLTLRFLHPKRACHETFDASQRRDWRVPRSARQALTRLWHNQQFDSHQKNLGIEALDLRLAERWLRLIEKRVLGARLEGWSYKLSFQLIGQNKVTKYRWLRFFDAPIGGRQWLFHSIKRQRSFRSKALLKGCWSSYPMDALKGLISQRPYVGVWPLEKKTSLPLVCHRADSIAILAKER